MLFISISQQQIHAQQLPHGAVVGGLPPGGLLGFAGAAAAAAAAGVPPHLAPPPHPAAAAAVQAQAQALLKPADLQQHRAAAETPEDRKPIALPDERLGHRSVSPPEKFRSRTPDLESDPKRRKEEKLGHVSTITGIDTILPPLSRAAAASSSSSSSSLSSRRDAPICSNRSAIRSDSMFYIPFLPFDLSDLFNLKFYSIFYKLVIGFLFNPPELTVCLCFIEII